MTSLPAVRVDASATRATPVTPLPLTDSPRHDAAKRRKYCSVRSRPFLVYLDGFFFCGPR